mmetsp:Transcript_14258/g.35387  ORF Transcript_14258/g.35387 Transcript_14258/m.35387 type:complete len:801 (+) Transcript_14258:238-2640(+)
MTDKPEAPGKLKGFLFWFMVFSSFYALATMIVAILAYIELADATDEVVGILRNWAIPPIADVTVVDQGANCPTDFQVADASWEMYKKSDISEMLGGKAWRQYDGVDYGCECWNARCVEETKTETDSDGNTREVTTCEYKSWHFVMNNGRCSGTQSSHGCNQFSPAVPNAGIHVWRGKKLCVKRGGLPAIERPPEHAVDGCPGDLPYDCQQEIGRPYCVANAAACPLYGLHLQAGANAVPDGWESVSAGTSGVSGFDGGFKLIFTRSRNKAAEYRAGTLAGLGGGYESLSRWNRPTPVLEFGVESCFHNPHVLGTEENKCGNRDARWIEFSRQLARAVYTDALTPAQYQGFSSTGILHNAERRACSLNGGSGACVLFEPTATDEWRAKQMPEVYWDTSCVKEGVERKKVKARRNPVEDVVSMQMAVLIFTILNTLANFTLMIMFGANYLFEHDWPCFPGEGHAEYKVMEKFRKYLGLACKALVLPFCIAAFVIATDIEDFFTNVKDLNCSDPDTNTTITKLADGISGVASKNLSAMVMTLFVFLLEFCLWLRAKRIQEKIDGPAQKPQQEDDGGAGWAGGAGGWGVGGGGGGEDPSGGGSVVAPVIPGGVAISPAIGVPHPQREYITFQDVCQPLPGMRVLKVILTYSPTDGLHAVQLVAEDETTFADFSFPRRPAEPTDWSGDRTSEELQLQPHEYIVKAEGYAGEYVQRLSFTTNLGNTITAAGSNDGVRGEIPFEVFGAPAIVGISGECGTCVDKLQFALGAAPTLATTGGSGGGIVAQPGAAVIVGQPGFLVQQPVM